MGLRSFLVDRDDMGVPFSITYKGSDTFPTLIGGIFTIGIKCLVLSQCVMLSLSMVYMSDPLVRSYERPLYRHEVSEFGEINLNDNYFDVGVYFVSASHNGQMTVPESVGRTMLKIEKDSGESVLGAQKVPLVNCIEQTFKEVDPDELERRADLLKNSMCIDPIHTFTSGVSTFGVEKFIAFEFEPCEERTDIDAEEFCMSEREVSDWLEEEKPKVKIVFSHNFIDFEAKKEPLKLSLSTASFGRMDQLTSWHGKVPLEYHQVTLSDDIYDPFGLDIQEYPFITPVKNDQFIYTEHMNPDGEKVIKWDIEMHLNGFTRIQERTKYGVWDLLGDVGGFHDGMFLVVGILLGPYAAIATRLDFTHKKTIDNSSSKRGQQFRSSDRFIKASNEIQAGASDKQLSAETLTVLGKMLGGMATIQQSFKSYIEELLGQAGRRKRMKARIEERMQSRLDLRGIIQAQIDLKILKNRLLSPLQKEMFRYQRDRQPPTLSASDSNSEDPDTTIYESSKTQALVESLSGFVPKTELDRRLLLGMIFRSAEVPSDQPPKQTLPKMSKLSQISSSQNPISQKPDYPYAIHQAIDDQKYYDKSAQDQNLSVRSFSEHTSSQKILQDFQKSLVIQQPTDVEMRLPAPIPQIERDELPGDAIELQAAVRRKIRTSRRRTPVHQLNYNGDI